MSDHEDQDEDELIDALEDDVVDAETMLSVDDITELGGEDLEAAYLKAMSALEASDLEIPAEAPRDSSSIDHNKTESQKNRATSTASIQSNTDAEGLPTNPVTEESLSAGEPTAPATAAKPIESQVAKSTPPETPMTPRQIIEACLFVGGDALSSRKLTNVLRGEFKSDFIDHEVDELNRLYAAESRPYEIRLGEGGYRLCLRDEYERIRHKVYGLGPKEVRLSQEALEVLAVVAYYQPIKQARVEELGKPGCGAVLRQLVRRELLAVERDPDKPREVNYKTTARFLSLFGIRDLDELPRHEQVSYK